MARKCPRTQNIPWSAPSLCAAVGKFKPRTSDSTLQRPSAQNLEELSLEAVEALLIRKALGRFQGNVSQAAEALGLSRGALYRRMEKYGI